MKKIKKSLAVLLSLILIISACTVVLNVSAVASAPVYDSSVQKDLSDGNITAVEGDYVTQNADGSYTVDNSATADDPPEYMSSTNAVKLEDITFDNGRVVYGSATIDPYEAPYDMYGCVAFEIARVRFGWSIGDPMREYNLVLKFTCNDGVDVQLLKDDEGDRYGLDGANLRFLGAVFTTFKKNYPDGRPTFGDEPRDVAWAISAEGLTVWVDGTVVIDGTWAEDIDAVVDTLGANWAAIEDFEVLYTIVGFHEFKNLAPSIVSNYRVWTDVVPEFDASKHIDLTAAAEEEDYVKAADGSWSGNTEFTKTKLNDAEATYYGTVTVAPLNSTGPTHGVMIRIADVAYSWNAGATNKDGTFIVKLTYNDGIDCQIEEPPAFLGANMPGILKVSYPDGGTAFGSEARTLTYSVNAEQLKIWVDDVLVIDIPLADTGFTSASTGNAFGPAIFKDGMYGIYCEGNWPAISNYRVWTVSELAGKVVTFDSQGGTAADAAITNVEGKVAELPAVTKVGYKFAGWFDAATAGNAITTDTVFEADTTVYAQWVACEHNTYGDDNICDDCGYEKTPDQNDDNNTNNNNTNNDNTNKGDTNAEKVPSTGDSSNVELIVALMLISALAALGVSVYRRKIKD